MSWKMTKQALITNRTGCDPCEQISNLRRDIGGHLGSLNSRVNSVSSTLASLSSSLGSLQSRFSDSDSATTFTYSEQGLFSPGPISVEFYMATDINGQSNKYLIDNNGKGYISLADLFTFVPSSGSDPQPYDLNSKIKQIVEKSGIGSDAYFIHQVKPCSKGQTPIKGAANCACYTISEFTILFGKGQSYVNTPGKQGFAELGDTWGAPVFFEIGGSRYPNDGDTFAPVLGPHEEFTIDTVSVGPVPVQIQQVRIVGEGQGATTIRGSCMFVIYNMVDSGALMPNTIASWASQPSFIAFSNRRVVTGGYLWAGHFGICTDYGPSFSRQPDWGDLGTHSPMQVGIDPIGGQGVYIPNYTSDTKATDGLPKDRSIEFLLIDAWIELTDVLDLGGLQPNITPGYIGYPVLTIGAIIPRRFYLKNVVCFSYEGMGTDCQGLCFINTSYIFNGGQGLPVDTFVENCTFAARNTNFVVPGQSATRTTAVSFKTRNSDKLSLMTSTFHGNMILQVNKLAAYNCYCLAVSQSTITDALVNYNMLISQSETTNPTGYGGNKSQSRIILQNMIFVTHLDRDKIQDALGIDIEKITDKDFTTALASSDYMYDATTGELSSITYKSLYPIQMDFKCANVFISGSTYYGIMMSKPIPPGEKPPADWCAPTFSALQLQTENIVNFKIPTPPPSPGIIPCFGCCPLGNTL